MGVAVRYPEYCLKGGGVGRPGRDVTRSVCFLSTDSDGGKKVYSMVTPNTRYESQNNAMISV